MGTARELARLAHAQLLRGRRWQLLGSPLSEMQPLGREEQRQEPAQEQRSRPCSSSSWPLASSSWHEHQLLPTSCVHLSLMASSRGRPPAWPHSSRAFATEAAPKEASSSAAQSRGKGKPPGGAAKSSSSSSSSDRPLDPVLAAELRLRPSRFLRLHQEVLQREMMLRRGAPPSWMHTPKIHAIDLTISARADTRLGHDDVEQSDLLLYRLALDHLTGGAPAPRFLPPVGRKGGALASGVTARLRGSQALDFFERLVHVVLPNQISFEGLGPARRLRRWGGDARPHWNPDNAPPDDLYSIKLRVDNLLLFPDFERDFELFEPLRSMQVDIQVAEAGGAEMARLYLAGFGLPLRRAGKKDGARS